MERVTITIDEELLDTIDDLVVLKGYASRSEAVRDLVRDAAKRDAAPEAPCIATLSYIYDHAVRGLAQRLAQAQAQAQAQHAHHDLGVASLQVQMDHDSRLEVAVLRGTSDVIRRFADAVTSQRGVRHHALHLVPTRVEEIRQNHGSGAHRHLHVHA